MWYPPLGAAGNRDAKCLARSDIGQMRISAKEANAWRLVEDPGKAFDVAMTLAGKVARQPPIAVAMTKLTLNRLTHRLADLASHMDADQFALVSMTA